MEGKQKAWKSWRMGRVSWKYYLLIMEWLLKSWSHSSCSYLQKTYKDQVIHSSSINEVDVLQIQGLTEELWAAIISAEGESFFVRIWPLEGVPCIREWPHSHASTASTNGIQWVIKNGERHEIGKSNLGATFGKVRSETEVDMNTFHCTQVWNS